LCCISLFKNRVHGAGFGETFRVSSLSWFKVLRFSTLNLQVHFNIEIPPDDVRT
jgi:hypothetical protein